LPDNPKLADLSQSLFPVRPGYAGNQVYYFSALMLHTGVEKISEKWEILFHLSETT